MEVASGIHAKKFLDASHLSKTLFLNMIHGQNFSIMGKKFLVRRFSFFIYGINFGQIYMTLAKKVVPGTETYSKKKNNFRGVVFSKGVRF